MSREFSEFEKLAMDMAGTSSAQSAPEPTPEPMPTRDDTDESSVNTEPNTSVEPTSNTDGTEDVQTATLEPEGDTSDVEDNSDLADIEDWDSDSNVEPTTSEVVLDFSEIGKALNDETIKTKEDAIDRIKDLQTKISELEKTKESVLENIPEDLKKAIELSKDGGNYLEYLGLSSVDYSQVDPVELFEYEVTQMFTDENGNVDSERLTEYLDGLSDIDKEIRGKQLQKQYVADQQAKKQQLAERAAEQKAKSNEQLQKVISGLDSIAGFKLKPSHKKTMFEDITSGKMVKDLFYDKQGNYDFQKITDNYFKIKNFDKIQNYYKQQVRSATKKEIINDMTNSNVNTPPQQPNAAPKTKSALDSYMESLMPKK